MWQGGARVFTTEKDSTAVVTGPAPATFALDVAGAPRAGPLRERSWRGLQTCTVLRIADHVEEFTQTAIRF